MKRRMESSAKERDRVMKTERELNAIHTSSFKLTLCGQSIHRSTFFIFVLWKANKTEINKE